VADWLSLIPPWKHPIDSLLSMERGKVGVRERIGEKGGREREGGREAGERLRRAERERAREREGEWGEREKRERGRGRERPHYQDTMQRDLLSILQSWINIRLSIK